MSRLKTSLQRSVPLLAILALTFSSESVFAKHNCPDSAQQFWKNFRSAAVKSDLSAVAGMTRFPFVVYIGILDDGRQTQQLARDKFIAIYPKLLQSDPGMTQTPTTMKNYIQSLDTLPSKFCNTSGQDFRVGDWVFQQRQGKWAFTQVYVEDDFEM